MVDRLGGAKDPIKKSPMPEPGQSVGRQIDDVILEHGVSWTVWLGLIAALSFVEWVKWFFDIPHSPMVFTAVLVIAAIVAYWNLRKLKKCKRRSKSEAPGVDRSAVEKRSV